MPDETPAEDKKPFTDRLAITIQGKFNQSREVVFQTTVPLDADEKVIYQHLAKVFDLMDRREEFYLLKGLRITLERDTAQLEKETQKVGALERQYQDEWDTSRRGPFKLSGQQKTNIENQRSGLAALKERIDKVKSEIAELEKLQKAYE